jgi:serine/threonine protein kinase
LAEAQKLKDMPWTRGSLLGEGGYGRVFECLNDDGRICAAKVVPLRPGDDERSRAAQEEIKKEVEVMKKLSHPNIVRYIGTERDEKELVIFLELVPGGSISSMLGKYGKFKESVVRGYCREILQGLGYLHANKILHRDIKGPNILVDFAGVCKLSDFGCSKELYGEIASTMTLKGTPQFMAPEVLRNQGTGYTEKADIWSVGCTVIEMCTARRPWPEFNTNEAVMYHVAMRDSCPKTPEWVSAECKDFCALCFARDPAKRPNVSELLRHALVHNAQLQNQQRLGTTAADPTEICLEMDEDSANRPAASKTRAHAHAPHAALAAPSQEVGAGKPPRHTHTVAEGAAAAGGGAVGRLNHSERSNPFARDDSATADRCPPETGPQSLVVC